MSLIGNHQEKSNIAAVPNSVMTYMMTSLDSTAELLVSAQTSWT